VSVAEYDGDVAAAKLKFAEAALSWRLGKSLSAKAIGDLTTRVRNKEVWPKLKICVLNAFSLPLKPQPGSSSDSSALSSLDCVLLLREGGDVGPTPQGCNPLLREVLETTVEVKGVEQQYLRECPLLGNTDQHGEYYFFENETNGKEHPCARSRPAPTHRAPLCLPFPAEDSRPRPSLRPHLACVRSSPGP